MQALFNVTWTDTGLFVVYIDTDNLEYVIVKCDNILIVIIKTNCKQYFIKVMLPKLIAQRRYQKFKH